MKIKILAVLVLNKPEHIFSDYSRFAHIIQQN